MPSPKVSVPVRIWRRLQTYDLEIAPSLAGMMHEFEHHGYRIKIQLPNRPRRSDWSNENARMQCRRYRQRSTRIYPVSFSVNSVDLTIETEKIRKIPRKSLGTVDHSLFSAQQLRSLDNFASRFEAIADSAFERWVDVLRWKTDIPTICAYRENKQKSHWSTYLYDASTDERFYCSPHRITAWLQKPISKKRWRSAAECLETNVEVPIWHLYVSEACQKRDLQDDRGFILNLAISVESVIRTVMNTYIVSFASSDFERMVGRLGITGIIERWEKINHENMRWKNFKKEKKIVKEVIKERNDVMHKGEIPSISAHKANEMISAVCKFIEECERQLSQSRVRP
jgi:hypothetical protein